MCNMLHNTSYYMVCNSLYFMEGFGMMSASDARFISKVNSVSYEDFDKRYLDKLIKHHVLNGEGHCYVSFYRWFIFKSINTVEQFVDTFYEELAELEYTIEMDTLQEWVKISWEVNE